jgi:hypothetical protein
MQQTSLPNSLPEWPPANCLGGETVNSRRLEK